MASLIGPFTVVVVPKGKLYEQLLLRLEKDSNFGGKMPVTLSKQTNAQ